METFDADWLALREPIDHRSRAESLLAPLCDTWRARGWSRVLDLGTGAGSNLRYLAPRLPAGQRWVLVDHDPDHLRTLRHAKAPASVRSLTIVPGDLVHEGLAAISHADLVTASAVLDLVSEDWLCRVVDACADAGRGAHFALSYDGEIRWSAGGAPGGQGEEDPDDALVRDAVNAHQTGDKGMGTALGPAAWRGGRAAVPARALHDPAAKEPVAPRRCRCPARPPVESPAGRTQPPPSDRQTPAGSTLGLSVVARRWPTAGSR